MDMEWDGKGRIQIIGDAEIERVRETKNKGEKEENSLQRHMPYSLARSQ